MIISMIILPIFIIALIAYCFYFYHEYNNSRKEYLKDQEDIKNFLDLISNRKFENSIFSEIENLVTRLCLKDCYDCHHIGERSYHHQLSIYSQNSRSHPEEPIDHFPIKFLRIVKCGFCIDIFFSRHPNSKYYLSGVSVNNYIKTENRTGYVGKSSLLKSTNIKDIVEGTYPEDIEILSSFFELFLNEFEKDQKRLKKERNDILEQEKKLQEEKNEEERQKNEALKQNIISQNNALNQKNNTELLKTLTTLIESFPNKENFLSEKEKILEKLNSFKTLSQDEKNTSFYTRKTNNTIKFFTEKLQKQKYLFDVLETSTTPETLSEKDDLQKTILQNTKVCFDSILQFIESLQKNPFTEKREFFYQSLSNLSVLNTESIIFRKIEKTQHT